MIGPVSGTGRAMMASLQQQMAKGMPPDQAIAYVKSMAQDGVAPLVDLYAMMKQFQRLKEQQVKPPQTPPTVRDQIMAMSQQGVPQQGQGMMPPQGAPGMAPPPMEQGLGGMNAGAMENPGFAGGGIVAFADGGDVVHMAGGTPRSQSQAIGAPTSVFEDVMEDDLLTSDEKKELAGLIQLQRNVLMSTQFDPASATLWERSKPRYQELIMKRKGAQQKEIDVKREAAAKAEAERRGITYVAPPTDKPAPTESAVPTPPQAPPAAPARVIKKPAAAAAAPKEMSLEDRIKEQQAPLIARGLLTKEGKSTATETYRNILKSEDERMDKYFGKQKSLALAEAGFKMAQAASRPGATFLGALSEGGMSHAQAMQAMNKEVELNRRQMQQQNYLLDKADEADARGEVDRATQLRAKHEDQMIDLQKHRERLLVDLKQIEVAGEGAAETRALRKDLITEQRGDKTRSEFLDLKRNDMQLRVLEGKLLKAKDPEDITAINAQIDARKAVLAKEARGEDLPGMQPEDVSRTSDAIANMSGETLAQRLRALGYTVNSPTR